VTVFVHDLGGNIPCQVERMVHRGPLDTPEEELTSARFRRTKVYVRCNSFGPHAIRPALSLYGGVTASA
jgi:hypothetical protein